MAHNEPKRRRERPPPGGSEGHSVGDISRAAVQCRIGILSLLDGSYSSLIYGISTQMLSRGVAALMAASVSSSHGRQRPQEAAIIAAVRVRNRTMMQMKRQGLTCR